jgi:NAD(P)-dependent dehydrogenase (short-subunit alcohol dehydrogenase family)
VAEVLEGKRIVVTGGSKGIGAGIVRDLCEHGARVVFCGRDEKSGAELARSLENGFFVRADVSAVEDCRALIDEAVDRLGGLDALVNNAGVFPRASLVEETEEQFDRVFAVDIKGAFFCSQYAIRAMDPDVGGSIVNMGSTHGFGGMYALAAYACAKGAMRTLTQHIALNYTARRVRCNWVTVGWVATEGEMALRGNQGQSREWLEEQGRRIIPLGRMQTAQDMADTVRFLVSDASSMVTGAEVPVTGGIRLEYGPSELEP